MLLRLSDMCEIVAIAYRTRMPAPTTTIGMRIAHANPITACL